MPAKAGDLPLTVTYDWPRVELGGGEGAPSAACNPGPVWGVLTCSESPLSQWAPPWRFPPPLTGFGRCPLLNRAWYSSSLRAQGTGGGAAVACLPCGAHPLLALRMVGGQEEQAGGVFFRNWGRPWRC